MMWSGNAKFVIALPLLFIALSWPLMLGKVPPNQWYGFRTSKTMSSAKNWYSGNHLGGKYLFIAGWVQLFAIAILFATRARSSTQLGTVSALMVATLPPAIAILVWSWRFSKL